MQTWIIWKENNPLLLKSHHYPRLVNPRKQIKSLVTNWVFKSWFAFVRSCFSSLKPSPLSFMALQSLLRYHHPPFHDEAFPVCVCVSAALSFLSYITKVNSFSTLHGSSISGIIFCVSRQICVCRVRGVCAGIVHWTDFYTEQQLFKSLSCVCPFKWFAFLFLCYFSGWLPVSTNWSANQQTAFQLFSCPSLTGQRWDFNIWFMNLKLNITFRSRVPNWRAGFRLNSLFPVFQIKTNKGKSMKKSRR